MSAVPIGEKIARLRHTLLFSEVPTSVLRAMAESADVVEAAPGTAVVTQGETGDALYVVTRGLLRARRHDGQREAVIGELNKGGFFGEFALLEDQPRNATVEAVVASQLLCLRRAAVQPMLAEQPELAARLQATLEIRRQAKAPPPQPANALLAADMALLFPGVTTTTIEKLGPAVEWMWLPAGATLLHQGDPGEAVYFVLSGRLRVFTPGPNGHSVTLGELSRGESVGEMALLTGSPRSASASILLDAALLRLSRAAFEQLLEQHPAAMVFFRQLLLERVTRRAQAEVNAGPDQTRRPVTLEDVESVTRTSDLVLRNFRITQSYHRLALDVRDLLGSADVNWLAFGAHASKTAGYAIRKEEVPLQEISAALHHAPGLGLVARLVGRTLATSFVARTANRMLERTSEAISDGNLRIFADMAPVIVRFLELIRNDRSFDAAKITAFRATLKPGPPEADGQEILGLALTAWYEAAHEPDPKRRSELVLLGNARMGWHEQLRVQPDIIEALGSPLRLRVGDELGHFLQQRLSGWPGLLQRPLLRGAHRLEPVLLEAASTTLKRIITRRMMRLRMPDGDVHLGRDLATQAGGLRYPPELRELTLPELVALAERFAPRDATPDGTGATDWADFGQRMTFIVPLFRSRQRNATLFDAPLAAEQMSRIDVASTG